ncbi:uncharacterized protein LOC9308516 isoform X2 [Arabidopsis lyrata subsp. lyrata]|uniref:uncharacterized protein LOC9308516 isoform X2 n=1 Tax=Arabidopsis lyrata subsp. lyrata TaxID=81972 RepID=UPI000A29C521|nr:uncharacterized protein LOC9308516 isoform X2 [Arabidopsis lyrata subsp. lyrata]|eukprot:XP_020878281.1 uncharacterized protein LOC9308516 isoform X2 [Arabidopsis lyrata subsp. lyrata]
MKRGSENNNHETKPSPTRRLRCSEISPGENSGDITIPTDLAFMKPICEKRTGSIGGLGVRKLNTKVEESYEARKKFPNAKSISSAQFLGDQNKASDLESEFTLEKLSNDFSSLVCKTKERLGTLGSVITGLKKDVTDLMHKLRSEDAHAIPWDTRMKWVEKVCDQLVEVTLGVDLAGGLGPTVYTLREDAWDLSEQLIIERDRERARRERESSNSCSK